MGAGAGVGAIKVCLIAARTDGLEGVGVSKGRLDFSLKTEEGVLVLLLMAC